ncbi:MAG TPA: L-threonylcarbamoyladenylate synthase [Candidatus Binataceae bacterium]|nr:L-threonylcarbamoyladenylate synthase [Candidatus Binataceae bacterium]
MTHPEIFSIDDGIEALRSGELVVYPTETFYGIAADPFSKTALKRLFEIKGRAAEKTVALIAADTRSAFSIAREVPPLARRLADNFWPGPLTLVVPARVDMPPELVGPGGGVGVRVSPHPEAHALAAGFGCPITATSANLAGQPPAKTLAEARQALGKKVKVYLEGGTLGASAPSTVVEVVNGEWRIIREGAVSRRQIAAALAEEALE